MRKLPLSILVLFAPTIALADPGTQAGKELDPFFNMWETMRDDPGSRAGSLKTDPQVADCDAAIAKARQAGLKDDARIYAYHARELDDVEYDDKREAYVTLADAAKVCAGWRKMLLLAPAAAKQTATASTQYSFSLVEPESLDNVDDFLVKGKECLETTDAAIKAGAPPDHKVKIREDVMSITEGRTTVCQGMIDWANALAPKIKAAHSADREKRAAPYKALGVAGAKLELFLEYDDVYWRGGRNCQVMSDLKQVAKAKALFHWLENSDGTHTIRKYTFAGNKVSGPISKTYRTAGAAQAGCK